MTESCACITIHPLHKFDYKYGHTVGAICANTEVKVIDLNGQELGLNEPGEVSSRCSRPSSLQANFADSRSRSSNHYGLPQQCSSHGRHI